MLDISGLAAIAAAFFVVAASPGPATIATATVAMSAGRKTGLRFGLGLSFGLAFWGIIAATGLGALLQASSYALTALKLLGGAYLLWLAYKAAKAAARPSQTMTTQTKIRYGFKQGLVLNLSNPKAVTAWIATLSLGLNNADATLQVIMATALCSALGFLIYAGYALAFSTPDAMNAYGRFRRWIEGFVAGFFAIAGFGLIRSVFARQ